MSFLKKPTRLRNYRQVDDSEWASQYDAAKELKLGMFRLSFVLANDHLDSVENSKKEQGVTRKSIAAEKQWRKDASFFKKFVRTLSDIINWI